MNKQSMSHMTWQEYAGRRNRVLILPIGSTEQHGPHLPLSVDAVIAEHFAALLAAEIDGTCAPVLTYGYKSKPRSGGGPLFPGTIDLNGATLQNLLLDLLMEFSADGYRNIFIVNAHFENDPFIEEAMDLASRRLGESARFVLSNWWDPIPTSLVDRLFDEVPFPGWALEHAAITETSLMMYFAPELVRLDKIEKLNPIAPPAYSEYPVRRDLIPESGVLASAYSSSAEKGRMIVEAVIPELKRIAAATFGEDAIR